ncbi:MAG: flagellar basal-body MS-ring/collar protein FliF [Rhodocyclaceae bacterium]
MFKNIHAMWATMSAGKRMALVGCCVLLLVLLAWACYLIFRENKEVLFSDLESRDQAAIVSQLDKLKVPYKISDDGRSILVDRESVHRTRLKVMSEGVDIKGTVGFEVFNGSDYGASEFAQKINYQRAVQGELSRTILSVEGVKHARVMLAMPDGSYLRRKDTKPTKASVALTLKEGVQLSAEQVQGIQRLVAASVHDLDASQVVVTDQKGVTLSRAAGGEEAGGGGSGKLEMKRQADQYLTRKISEMLDRALGQGQAIVSADVTLNHDQVSRSREELLGLSSDGRDSQGAILRKRSNSSQQAAPAGGDAAQRSAAATGGRSESLDIEYGYGKSVEQVMSSPGNIKRISVGVFLTGQTDTARTDKIREIVAMAVGFNPQRGDGISVQSLGVEASAVSGEGSPSTQPETSRETDRAMLPAPQEAEAVVRGAFLCILLLILAVLILAGFVLSRGRLSAAERQALLKDMQDWLGKDDVASSKA